MLLREPAADSGVITKFEAVKECGVFAQVLTNSPSNGSAYPDPTLCAINGQSHRDRALDIDLAVNHPDAQKLTFSYSSVAACT